jgi:hypothetical protein
MGLMIAINSAQFMSQYILNNGTHMRLHFSAKKEGYQKKGNQVWSGKRNEGEQG